MSFLLGMFVIWIVILLQSRLCTMRANFVAFYYRVCLGPDPKGSPYSACISCSICRNHVSQHIRKGGDRGGALFSMANMWRSFIREQLFQGLLLCPDLQFMHYPDGVRRSAPILV